MGEERIESWIELRRRVGLGGFESWIKLKKRFGLGGLESWIELKRRFGLGEGRLELDRVEGNIRFRRT